MHRWHLRIDRRVVDLDALRPQIAPLIEGVEGCQLTWLEPHEIEGHRDEGAFRDFVPVATLRAPHAATLEYVAELLLEDLGWVIDFKRTEPT